MDDVVASTRANRIYVQLLDEGSAAWRPVQAERLDEGIYRIVSVNEDPGDEAWQFQTNDVVRCESNTFSGGQVGLVAVELHPDPSSAR